MAATFEALEEKLDNVSTRVGQRITIPWTSASDGTYSEVLKNLRGFIVEMYFKPGSAAPTSYGVTLKRTGPSSLQASFATLDVLGGAAAGRSATVQEPLPLPNTGVPYLCYVNGDYTFAVANAGSAKQGTCEILIKNR